MVEIGKFWAVEVYFRHRKNQFRYLRAMEAFSNGIKSQQDRSSWFQNLVKFNEFLEYLEIFLSAHQIVPFMAKICDTDRGSSKSILSNERFPPIPLFFHYTVHIIVFHLSLIRSPDSSVGRASRTHGEGNYSAGSNPAHTFAKKF